MIFENLNVFHFQQSIIHKTINIVQDLFIQSGSGNVSKKFLNPESRLMKKIVGSAALLLSALINIFCELN